MQVTETLYHSAPYERHVPATILEINPMDDGDGISLDKTIFHPEGGGQPGDRGRIGGYTVLDTREDPQGRILHLVASSHTLSVGMLVELELDWDHRYHFMQQHTAQHLLSGTLHRMFGIGTVSVHLGEDEFAIELDVPQLSPAQVLRLEDEVNAIVGAGAPVEARTVTHEQSESLGLRRPVKVDGDVRIISIGTYDIIACGGVHVDNTRELRYLQFLRNERIRGHVRTFWIAGDRSVSCLRRNRDIVDESGTALSTPASEIVRGIRALQEQLADCRYHARASLVRIATLLLERELDGSAIPVAVFDAASWSEEEFTSLPEALLAMDSIALCAVRARDDGKLSWMIALKGVRDAQALFQTLKEEVLPGIGGKGGGKEPLWQGIGLEPAGKDRFLEHVRTMMARLGHG